MNIYLSSSTIRIVCLSSIPVCSPVFFCLVSLYCRAGIQPENKSGPALRPVLCPDFPTVGFHNLPAYGKPQSHPVFLVRSLTRESDKLSEDGFFLSRRDTLAVIFNNEVCPSILI